VINPKKTFCTIIIHCYKIIYIRQRMNCCSDIN